MKSIITLIAVTVTFAASFPAFAGDYLIAGGGMMGGNVNVRGTNLLYTSHFAAKPGDNVFCQTGHDYCYAIQ